MKSLVTPFRVGILVIVAFSVLFGILTFVKKGGMSEEEGVTVYAFFRDASGLGKKSRVQIAGIQVGEIVDIKLEDARARIILRIRRDVGLRENAALSKRSESLLGDYLLDLSAGTPEAPPLQDGGEIRRVVDAQGMEQVFGSLSAITADIQAVTGSLKNVLGGEKGQGSLEAIIANLLKLSESVDGVVRESTGRLERILQDVEAISGDVRRLTEGEKGSIRNIVANIDSIAVDVRDVIASVKRVVGQNEGEVAGQVSTLKDTLARLDSTLANLESLTTSVKEGKGTVGALLADERLGQRLSETLEDVADYASRLTSAELEVGARTEYLFSQAAAKNTVALRLVTKPDKYYLLEAVDDPRGTVETLSVQQNPPAVGEPVVQRQSVTRETMKFSAQFAKRFSLLTLRFGLIESTGGLGVDLNVPLRLFSYSRWLEDALVLKLDAFDFSARTSAYPRLRASLRFTPVDHLYVTAGVDDILNAHNRDLLTNRLLGGRDIFLGAGVAFTDADLKSVLPLIPSP